LVKFQAEASATAFFSVAILNKMIPKHLTVLSEPAIGSFVEELEGSAIFVVAGIFVFDVEAELTRLRFVTGKDTTERRVTSEESAAPDRVFVGAGNIKRIISISCWNKIVLAEECLNVCVSEGKVIPRLSLHLLSRVRKTAAPHLSLFLS